MAGPNNKPPSPRRQSQSQSTATTLHPLCSRRSAPTRHRSRRLRTSHVSCLTSRWRLAPGQRSDPCSWPCVVRKRLDLLGAPAGIRLAHVRRRLDGGDELEDDVSNADETDDGTGNDSERAHVEHNGADKDVDWRARSVLEGYSTVLAPRENGRGCAQLRRSMLGLLTDTTTEEGEQERGIARDLGRDLELEESRSW